MPAVARKFPTGINVDVISEFTTNGGVALGPSVVMAEIAAPAVSAAGTCRFYFDSTSKTLKISQDGGAYSDVVGGGLLALSATGTVNIGTESLGSYAAIAAGAEYNVAIGFNALAALTSGDDNVMIGQGAGDALTIGLLNIGIGKDALGALISGNNNIALGQGALDVATTASNCVAIGADALASVTSSDNVGIGYRPAVDVGAASSRLIAIGYNPMGASGGVVGVGTIAIGSQAAYYGRLSAQGEFSSVAIGFEALMGNSTSANNSGIGNVAIGPRALQDAYSGNGNIGIGREAGDQITTGAENVVIGYQAGGTMSTGTQNVVIGSASGPGLTTGGSNVFLGAYAGGSVNVVGSIALGYNVSVDNSYELQIGRAANAVVSAQNLNNAANTTLALAALAGIQVSGGTSGTYVALTSSVSITPDFAAGNNFSLTLAHNTTLQNPSGINAAAGQAGVIAITQDGVGTRTMAFASSWIFAGGTAPTLTTTPGATDLLCWQVISSTQIVATLVADVQ